MPRGRPKGSTGPNGLRPGSRKYQMVNLKLGESVIFVGQPGVSIGSFQAQVAASFRLGQNMSNQGLTQQGGLAIFEGELARPLTKVTRFKEVPYADQ